MSAAAMQGLGQVCDGGGGVGGKSGGEKQWMLRLVGEIANVLEPCESNHIYFFLIAIKLIKHNFLPFIFLFTPTHMLSLETKLTFRSFVLLAQLYLGWANFLSHGPQWLLQLKKNKETFPLVGEKNISCDM